MKKTIFLASILLILANLAHADMLVSTNDTTAAVDSIDFVTLHFSDSEIMKIINESGSLNPQIQNLSEIRILLDTIRLKINDSSFICFVPQKAGASCWMRLKEGVKNKDLMPISTESSESISFSASSYSDSAFLDRIDSILGNNNNTFLSIDSNLSEEEPLVVTNSNSAELKPLTLKNYEDTKTPPTIRRDGREKVSTANNRVKKEVSYYDSMRMFVLDSLRKDNEIKASLIKTDKRPYHEDVDNYSVYEQEDGDLIILLKVIGGIIFVILIIYLFRRRNKRRLRNQATGIYSDEYFPLEWNKKNDGETSQLE